MATLHLDCSKFDMDVDCDRLPSSSSKVDSDKVKDGLLVRFVFYIRYKN